MAGAPSARTHLFAELKRLCVFRVAGAYPAPAFHVPQTANRSFRRLKLPGSAFRLIVTRVIRGFVSAAPPAWACNLGPGGLQRTLPAGVAPAGGTQPLVLST